MIQENGRIMKTTVIFYQNLELGCPPPPLTLPNNPDSTISIDGAAVGNHDNDFGVSAKEKPEPTEAEKKASAERMRKIDEAIAIGQQEEGTPSTSHKSVNRLTCLPTWNDNFSAAQSIQEALNVKTTELDQALRDTLAFYKQCLKDFKENTATSYQKEVASAPTMKQQDRVIDQQKEEEQDELAELSS